MARNEGIPPKMAGGGTTIDFFQGQETARRNTKRLIGLFVLAVVSIILLIYALVTAVFAVKGDGAVMDIGRLSAVVAGVLIVVGLGSMYKTMQVSKGGGAIARLFGGSAVHSETKDEGERRLVNVVEEMSIASGTPVPEIYVLEGEQSINAFAAGFTPRDAAVAVTRGALEKLSREELQGVVAHEFSHIFHGDMRLNIRLMGVLHGILCIAMAGWIIVRSGLYASRGNSKEGGGGGAALAVLGFGLIVIGGVGVFFARLIKAGVSRQREFLADAAAVQFTRNPDGLAGALSAIGRLDLKGKIKNGHAEEASHMFFASGLNKLWIQSLSTHPPIEERVRRLVGRTSDIRTKTSAERAAERTAAAPGKKKQFELRRGKFGALEGLPGGGDLIGGGMPGGQIIDGVLIGAMAGGQATKPPSEDDPTADTPSPATSPEDGQTIEADETREATREILREDPVDSVDHVGDPTPEHVEYARDVLAGLPADIIAAAHNPFDAHCLVYALLLTRDGDDRQNQLRILARNSGAGTAHRAADLRAQLTSLEPRACLPLVEITLPALRQLSPRQFESFESEVTRLASADASISIFEYALQKMILRHLRPHFAKGRPARRTKKIDLEDLTAESRMVLSSLAHAGRNEDDAVSAFRQGSDLLQSGAPIGALLAVTDCTLQKLDHALDRLAQTNALVKRRVLLAGARTVSADGIIDVSEGELLRAIADSLDCPMPPLLTTGKGIGDVVAAEHPA